MIGNYNVKDKIKEIVIEEGIKNIGSNAFNGMNNLERMLYKGDKIECGNQVFSDDINIESVYVPSTYIS